MPRVRKPNAEQIRQDKQIVASFTHAIEAIAKRHGSERLLVAVELTSAFAASPTPAPTPRVRKPKVTEPRSLNEAMWRDGKSAAANDDTRELAHHSV